MGVGARGGFPHLNVRRRLLVCGLIGAGVAAAGLLLRCLPHAIGSGDAAIAEIFVLHVTRGPWALGPYSQFYWNHPGPLMFQVLAPLYALSGQHAQALNVGATLVNVGAIAALLWTVARSREPVAMVAVSATLCVWLLRASDTLSSFWNPVLIALPAVLFVWLCASTAAGHVAVVAVVVVASFLAQSHVGLVPLAGVLSLVAVAIGWRRAWTSETANARATWRRGLMGTGLVGAALWALPIAEELTNRPGNLTTVAAFFATAPHGQRSLSQSTTIWSGALTQLVAPGFHQPIGVPVSTIAGPGIIAIGLLLVVALAATAWLMRRRRLLAYGAAFHALAAAVALAATHRMPGLVGDYTLFWLAPIGVSALALIAAATLVAATARVHPDRFATVGRVAGWLPAGVLILAVAAAALDLRGHLTASESLQQTELAALDQKIHSALQARAAVDPLVYITDDAWAEAAGTLLQMYKRGERFSIDPAWTFMYGRPLTEARCHTHALRFRVRGGDAPAGPIDMGRIDVGIDALGPCPGGARAWPTAP